MIKSITSSTQSTLVQREIHLQGCLKPSSDLQECESPPCQLRCCGQLGGQSLQILEAESLLSGAGWDRGMADPSPRR